MPEKVKLKVMGLTYSQNQAGSYALVLAEEYGNIRIPIMIGAFEAQAIALHLEDLQPPRPLTHDLFRSFADAFGIGLQEVFIHKLEEGIFYAELLFVSQNGLVRIDSRTSDAVALALRFKCPIFTTREVCDKAGVSLDESAKMNESLPQDEDEVESDEYHGLPPLETLPMEELELLLKEAVEEEDYEEASRIRDEIKHRKQGKKS